MGIEVGIAFFAGMLWWQFIVMGILGIGFVASLVNESSVIFGITLAVFMGFFWNVLGLGTLSVSSVLIFLVVYIGFGLLWSLYKWRLFVLEKKEEYINNRQNYTYPKDYTNQDIIDYVSRSKDTDQILFWVVLFPFSMLGYFINDFILDIIKKMTKVYDKITENIINSN